MSHYITCHNCGEPECMDSDTGVHRRDDGTVCPDPRDAEVEGLRADVARLTRERDELAVFRAAGHAETCDGMDEAEGRCACGYLQRQGAHAALVAAWAERDELARWRETHTVTPTIRIRAEAAEAEVARLRAAALPEDAEERAAEVMWARAVTRLGDASLPWASMSDDGHVKRFWREEARAVLAALRRDA